MMVSCLALDLTDQNPITLERNRAEHQHFTESLEKQISTKPIYEEFFPSVTCRI